MRDALRDCESEPGRVMKDRQLRGLRGERRSRMEREEKVLFAMVGLSRVKRRKCAKKRTKVREDYNTQLRGITVAIIGGNY